MGQLYAYLLSDDVDLTEEQASTAIGMMYDNISTGVEGGYLALIVDSSTPEDEGTDTGTEEIGGTDETEGTGGTGGTDEGKEETGDNRKPDFDREIDIPESLSPDVKAVFDEFFQSRLLADYFFSNCAFNSARPAMSPKVVFSTEA